MYPLALGLYNPTDPVVWASEHYPLRPRQIQLDFHPIVQHGYYLYEWDSHQDNPVCLART
jgi:hypothetical protein